MIMPIVTLIFGSAIHVIFLLSVFLLFVLLLIHLTVVLPHSEITASTSQQLRLRIEDWEVQFELLIFDFIKQTLHVVDVDAHLADVGAHTKVLHHLPRLSVRLLTSIYLNGNTHFQITTIIIIIIVVIIVIVMVDIADIYIDICLIWIVLIIVGGVLSVCNY